MGPIFVVQPLEQISFYWCFDSRITINQKYYPTDESVFNKNIYQIRIPVCNDPYYDGSDDFLFTGKIILPPT